MRKVKSEKVLAETTRTLPGKTKPRRPAAAGKGAHGAASGSKRGAKGPAPASTRRKLVKPKGATKAAVRSTARKQAPKPPASKRLAAGGKKQPVEAAPVYQIRQLDPVRVCGDRTSVVQLFRVDEQAMAVGKAAGARQVHLVFNDRHGWYCEHGRSCHAVSAVMRHAGIR